MRPRRWRGAALLTTLLLVRGLLAGEAPPPSDGPRAVTGFPGGSPRVVTVAPKGEVTFKVTSEAGWARWWFVAVEGIRPGMGLTVRTSTDARQPVVSEDGRNWRHFEAQKPVAVSGAKAWFAWYVPYLLENAQELARGVCGAGRPARARELCRSEAGHPVVLLQIGAPSERPKPVVWVQARQHAWEVGGSWTAQGLAEWAASDDARAQRLRAQADLIVVPIMDVDNVQRGNGGKDQKPHDHNRDWTAAPHWAAVRAAQAELDALIAANRLPIFLDLHDPGWGGGLEFWIGGLKLLAPEGRAGTERFVRLVKSENKAGIPFSRLKETGAGYGGGRTAGAWVRDRAKGAIVSGTLEIPVAPPKGWKEPPPSHHRLLGRQLGAAIARWLAGEDAQGDPQKAQ